MKNWENTKKIMLTKQVREKQTDNKIVIKELSSASLCRWRLTIHSQSLIMLVTLKLKVQGVLCPRWRLTGGGSLEVVLRRHLLRFPWTNKKEAYHRLTSTRWVLCRCLVWSSLIFTFCSLVFVLVWQTSLLHLVFICILCLLFLCFHPHLCFFLYFAIFSFCPYSSNLCPCDFNLRFYDHHGVKCVCASCPIIASSKLFFLRLSSHILLCRMLVSNIIWHAIQEPTGDESLSAHCHGDDGSDRNAGLGLCVWTGQFTKLQIWFAVNAIRQ